MISLSEIGGLYQSLPANLKDIQTKAFCYTIDKQITKLLERAEKIKVWSSIETVDERYLDHMAADCRTLFYDPSLPTDAKRKLIANSQYWYMKLGSLQAIEEMFQIAFQNETSIKQWFEYGGSPYHFRIYTKNIEIDHKKHEELKAILNKIKRFSAQLDAIQYIFEDIIQQPINYKTVLKLTSDFYPRSNIPFLKYDGTAQYNDTVRYDKYKSAERIALYPIRLHMASEFKSRMFFFPKIQMQQIFSIPIYHTETKVGYIQENKLYTTLEQALQIKLQTLTLPHYEISLKIGKHPNRYNGKTKYDGKSRYYVAKIENL